jgi:hypothetical protein
MAAMWILIAVLLAAVGKLLIDNRVMEADVSTVLERVWNHTTVRLATIPANVYPEVQGDVVC